MTNSERLCRICVKEKTPLVSILEDNPLNLQDKLAKLLKIKVSEGSLLPKQLCLECLAKLNSFNEFFTQTHENQVILQVIFGEKSETVDNQNPVPIAVECTHQSTQTEQSETFILIENFQDTENQLNISDGETIIDENEGEDESQETLKMDIEIEQYAVVDDENTSKVSSKDVSFETKARRKFDRFDCYVCEAQLSGNFQFIKHFTAAHPKDEFKYQCYVCKGFVKKYRSYTRHIESHIEKRFECDVCNQKFSQKITLMTHLSSHSSLKKFECRICNLSFKQNSSLFKHRKQKHSSEVPTCQQCNRSFVNNETYQQHLKSKHNQQMKDISCDECEKKFASKSALAYHRLSNHPKDKTQKLQCEKCAEEFKNRIILGRHQKKCTKS